MSLIFYYAPMSTATVTHLALEELGIPYEKVKMDFTSGDLAKPPFLALNPNAKVPVIVHDGTPIFESIAIAIYLGETFGVEKKLFPPPGPRRGEALKWLVWSGVSLMEAISRHRHNTSDRVPVERHNAKAAEAAKADVEKHLGILDGALAGKTWLVGDAFTLVDSHLGGIVGYAGMCGFDTKRFPHLQAWLERCNARPAASTVMKGG
ncbi:MAG: Glutathione S-transferase [Myxococcaceae bacterium]|jgi:glutathione S-transferase|nr:Glutathione S-transferase [Myxococcaceae bacterium]MEA2751874.1 hypothetical protein [Myxococcales bacterium]